MIPSANHLSKQKITPATNPELWYQWYEIVKQDAPEILDTFIENTAAKMELTVDYFMMSSYEDDRDRSSLFCYQSVGQHC